MDRHPVLVWAVWRTVIVVTKCQILMYTIGLEHTLSWAVQGQAICCSHIGITFFQLLVMPGFLEHGMLLAKQSYHYNNNNNNIHFCTVRDCNFIGGKIYHFIGLYLSQQMSDCVIIKFLKESLKDEYCWRFIMLYDPRDNFWRSYKIVMKMIILFEEST